MKRLRIGAFVGLGLLLPSAAAALPADLDKLGDDKERELERKRRIAGEPGSGVPLERQIRPTDAGRLQAPLPVRPKSDKESEALDTLEQLLGRYKSAHHAASHTVGELLKIEGADGRRALENHYDRQIREHQAKARKMRAQAIRRYSDFLEVHPDDATWTPEIMYRLAELYFEASTERLARQEDAFAKEVDAYVKAQEKNPDAQVEPPASPKADYSDSIALYRGIVGRFPRFHLGDGALYMMGTLLYEMEQPEQSRQSYLALACANKFDPPDATGSNVAGNTFPEGIYEGCDPWKQDSEFVAEAWLRIGETHYDADQFGPALDAYAKAASSPEDDLYDEALIRVAWTLYLMREFPRAAKKFDEFILYADARRDSEEVSGALALRDDAVRYLAKTYVEEDWDNDGNPDRVRGYRRLDRDYRERGNERHVPEVYAALGDLLAYQTDYQTAIGIWQSTLDRWPLAAAAPSIQNRILEAYQMLQEKEGATRARDALATNYLRGTKWFYANEDDPDTIEAALKLAEGALVATAVDHHVYAQELRGEGKTEEAKVEYGIAARAYEAYLERFPDTEASYEYRYNFADALYYAGDYPKAAAQFAEVRDSNIDNRLQEEAASGAVLSYEAYLEQQITAGGYARPDMPKDGMEGPFDQPSEIPEIELALQEAYDRFVALRPDADEAGTMAYQAAEISQRYLRFDEAQARFERVIDDYCSQNIAINAGQAILDARVVLGDLEGAQEWTQTLGEKGCGEGAEKEKFAGQLTALGNAVRFKEATILYDAGEFEAAADRYVALVDQAPKDPNADRALNNAAVAYENIGRFSSASQTYKRIYSDYPDSEFADDALLRTGFNHSRFFEYEEAVGSYTILAEDERYKDSEYRDEGLKNAAEVLDALQEYERSSQMYQRFAAQTDDPTEAAEARFKAAQVLGKTDQHKKTIAAYQNFLNQHTADAGQSERVVEAQLRIGQAHAQLGNRKKAFEYYRQTVAEFETRQLKPASEAADFPSEAQFLLATAELEKVSSARIKSTRPKKLEKESKQLLDSVVAASKEFDKVVDYKRVDWALGATLSKGRALEQTAINLRDAPVPKSLKEYSEVWFAYKDEVGRAADQFEAMAISEYEATIKLSKAYSVENEFTRAARERLNIYKPDEYPLLRQPALDMQVEDLR
ncbi:MAG: tetratricopeptide repeat protein [Nannocystaceae bacterium]|nr:tetratricopeptide repeat protein [bacterium]